MKREFEDFLSQKVEPPRGLTEQVLSSVEAHIEPPLSRVLPRFVGVYLTAGLLTIAVCPQFGLGPLYSGVDLAAYFMQIGMWACGIFCGVMFLGFGSLISMLFLTREEIKTIRNSSLWLVPGLSAVTLGVLMVSGYAVSGTTHYFNASFVAFWMFGAIFGSRFVINFLAVLRLRAA